MIHYHGLPITPDIACAEVLRGGHAFVSFARPEQLWLAVDLAQSFAVDNGAFSAWRSGSPITDWSPYYAWVEDVSRVPSFDFAVIPDTIDGSEDENDALIAQWPLGWFGAPVWHLHESLTRLEALCRSWPRVCLGSSGRYATIGTEAWWQRMGEAMSSACDAQGRPTTKLHGLRMLSPLVVESFPFSSADSTNVGQNLGQEARWSGTYSPSNKATRAAVLRGRIEAFNAPHRWTPRERTLRTPLFSEEAVS